MAIFRYQHGDRPLEGYTIRHGLGRGGFGEVYYAVSDSGREVALKAVQNYEDIELRGIKHCMNLKHAQLVSIFDIRHNADGLPFVIMEFVDGPSLREIMDSHPEGLGTAKAAFFFQELAKGLGYLHESGVVHRDLKPHNVFYEQGVVKVGDYSLSKAISTSHRGGHTMTVGTVHYMAPEISLGRYDHTVDIYALGVILYEMLTGHPPFLGESMGEVLMKHVNSDVDVSNLPEPFGKVINKALSKDPEARYQSTQAMVDDLMGYGDLRNSVASLGPESLTMVAERAAKSRKSPPPLPEGGPGSAGAAPTAAPPVGPQASDATGHWKNDHASRDAKNGQGNHPILTLLFFVGMIAVSFACLNITARVGNPLPLIFMGAACFFALRFKKGLSKKQIPPAQFAKPHAGSEEPIMYAKVADPGEADVGGPHVTKPRVEHPKYAHRKESPADRPMADESFDPYPNASPYSRLISLLMSLPIFLGFPVAGLQRLYVGKVKSGLLWLFTFGLFGIGQLYDLVMIALGHFRDIDGRRVLYFTRERFHQLHQPVNQYSAVMKRQWTESRIGFRLGNLVLNLIGGILLVVALILGMVLAVDVPGAFADGVFGYEVQRDLVNLYQVRDWNELASVILAVATTLVGSLAAVCLIFARRDSTWTHLFRVPLASGGFVLSVISLGSISEFGGRWPWVAESVNDRLVGAAIRELPDLIPGLVGASICFVAAMFVLAWPAKRGASESAAPQRQPAEQRPEVEVLH